MTYEIVRELVDGEWVTRAVNQGGAGGPVTAADIDSQAASNGEVLTADGTGGADWQPGGGSTPGVLAVADYIFNEPGGAHANLTASFVVPAGATILDVWLYPIAAPWADAAAGFAMADGLGGNDYFNPAILTLGSGGLDTAYDPTSITSSNFGNFSTWGNGYALAPPFVNLNIQAGAPPGGGILYPSGDTLHMAVTGIATGGGGGQLLVRIVYLAAITPVVAT